MNEKSRPDAKPNPGWFGKGRSGNPKGRPKSSPTSQTSTLDVVVEKTLTVTHPDGPREITIKEALQQRTFQDALKGKRMAQRQVLRWIEKNEAWKEKHAPKKAPQPIRRLISDDPDNADAALVLLGIAAHNPKRADVGLKRAQLLLEPWAVQAALSRRRGGNRLTDGERDWIIRCTRDPDTLRWPRGTNG